MRTPSDQRDQRTSNADSRCSIIKKVVEVAPDKALEAEMVGLVTFNEIAQQAAEAARLDRLHLGLQRIEIGGKGELCVIRKRIR